MKTFSIFLCSVGVGLILFVLAIWFTQSTTVNSTPIGKLPQAYYWRVQSIDTMKLSRDASRNPMTQEDIDEEVKNIAEVGATHVAIGTPYNEEFVPRMEQWVAAARKHNLHVWFRGNWAEWEGWFGYKKEMSKEQHLALTKEFILKHPLLFVDGDIFTACPECENGAIGDPRKTDDVAGFRAFMINEKKTVDGAFATINKKVITNYNSMNGDVARLVMDKATTSQMGGIISVDHYVGTPQRLVADLKSYAQQSGGKIILGEFGVPLPDIHGEMTEEQQAAWIQQLLTSLLDHPEVVGMNYWVDRGGSTLLWNDDGTPRKAVDVLRRFYKPSAVTGRVTTAWGNPISTATVSYFDKKIEVNSRGEFALPFSGAGQGDVTITAKDFESITIPSSQVDSAWKSSKPLEVSLKRTRETLSDVVSDGWKRIVFSITNTKN